MKLTLAQAQTIISAALKGPRTGPDRFLAVCVADLSGQPLAVVREERAAPVLAHVAEAKAHTALAWGPSKKLMAAAEGHPDWFSSISGVAEQRMGQRLYFSLGAVLIRDEAGEVVGAVGVAGEKGEQDEALAILGIEAAGLKADAG